MPRDPFTDAPLRPRNDPSVRGQTSQQSLRSNASTASGRTRQQRDLFAPSLSRRPTSRSTPRVEDEVLADRDSEGETAAGHRQRPLRRIRQGSPEGRHGRAKPKVEEELEIVNRQADGGYLLGMSAAGDAGAPELYAMELQAEREATEMDEEDAKIARSYFASGCAFSGRSSKKLDQGYDAHMPDMMIRMREQAMKRRESERWMFEPLDRYHTRLA